MICKWKSVRAKKRRPGAVALSWAAGEHGLGYGPSAAWSPFRVPSTVHPATRVAAFDLSLTSDDSAVPVLGGRCRGILRSLCRRRAPTSRYSHPRLPFLLCETEHPNPNLVLLFDAMMPTRLLILQAFLAKKKKIKKIGCRTVDTHLHLPLLGPPLGHILVSRGHTC